MQNTAAQLTMHSLYGFAEGKRGESALIVYRELSSLERDLGIRASTLYAVSNMVDDAIPAGAKLC